MPLHRLFTTNRLLNVGSSAINSIYVRQSHNLCNLVSTLRKITTSGNPTWRPFKQRRPARWFTDKFTFKIYTKSRTTRLNFGDLFFDFRWMSDFLAHIAVLAKRPIVVNSFSAILFHVIHLILHDQFFGVLFLFWLHFEFLFSKCDSIASSLNNRINFEV